MDDARKEFKILVLELIEVPEDNRESEILERLELISPDPAFLDYIFQSDEFTREDGSFDADTLSEKVFSYKPIEL